MPLFVWALFVAFLRFCFLCGAASVPGAACCVRPGCAMGGGPPASRPRREPFARAGCCLWRRWCSGRRRPRPPARLGDLTSFGAAPRSPPVPSGPSGALHTGGAWCAGVWLGVPPRSRAGSRHRPPAPPPGPVGQLGLLSETVVAFAGAGRASIETAIAFAGAKWAFSVQFSGAEVMPVSMVAVQGRAVVMVVSRWSASAVAVVMAVSQLPRSCVLCAK